MELVFKLVENALRVTGGATGLSYNEINIVAYYLVLPFIYVALIDRIIRRHFLKIGYVVCWIVALFCIPDFSAFSDWLFARSVDFLLLFSAVGLDYVAASVVVCVVLPGILFLALLALAFPRLRPWRGRDEPVKA